MRVQIVILALLLASAGLNFLPTAAAETCEVEDWRPMRCTDCPGPGYHENCRHCSWTCQEGPGCEYECPACEPGDAQGEVYSCVCASEDPNSCAWTQHCDDSDNDMRCDAQRSVERSNPSCIEGRICFQTQGIPEAPDLLP